MKYLAVIILLLTISSYHAQNVLDSLDHELTVIAEKKMIPGFGALIIRDGEIRLSNGYGYANVEDGIRYTDQTIQNIGSISKTFIGVSLMKAEDLGILDLDDPISQYLGYEIRNPKRSKEVITIRHLATHTAMLRDPEDYERAYIFEEKITVDSEEVPNDWMKLINVYNSNEREGLDEFIKSVYLPGGQYYSKRNFSRKKAGKKFIYSNIGAGIASRIIENASGMSFEDFTETYVFKPLGMKSTSWRLENVNLDMKSIPYLSYDLALPHYSLITFADGGLITSVHDLGLYIIEMMKCYNGQGNILSEDKTKEMMEPYLDKSKTPYGIFWETSPSGLSKGHNGGDPGTTTFMYFVPKTGVAKVLFVNITPLSNDVGKEVGLIWNTMKKYEDRI